MTPEQKTIRTKFKELRSAPLQMFPKTGKPDAPNRRGVYLIYSPQGEVLHVGSTPSGKNGLAQRLGDHISGTSSFKEKYLKVHGYKLRDGYKFRCLVVEDDRLRALLEAYAAGYLCPVHFGNTPRKPNTTPKK